MWRSGAAYFAESLIEVRLWAALEFLQGGFKERLMTGTQYEGFPWRCSDASSVMRNCDTPSNDRRPAFHIWPVLRTT